MPRLAQWQQLWLETDSMLRKEALLPLRVIEWQVPKSAPSPPMCPRLPHATARLGRLRQQGTQLGALGMFPASLINLAAHKGSARKSPDVCAPGCQLLYYGMRK